MLLSVHVRPSSGAAIRDCRIPCQFIGFQPLRPVAAQLICLFQESLIHDAYGWDESLLQQSYAQESLNGEIIIVDENPVCVFRLTDLGDQLHLTWMEILPEKQNQGLATASNKSIQQQAREKSKVLTLQVMKSNPAQLMR